MGLSTFLWRHEQVTKRNPFLCPGSHHGLHACPALLLFLFLPHILQILLCLCKRLQESVEDAKKFIWLHLALILSKMLQCLGILSRGQKTQEQQLGRQADEDSKESLCVTTLVIQYPPSIHVVSRNSSPSQQEKCLSLWQVPLS